MEFPGLIRINESVIKKNTIPRKISSRKGDNGIVLVVGGSRIYHGAPILASIAALRVGTDLVYTAVPKSNVNVTRTASPNLIVLPLSDERLTVGSSFKLIKSMPKRVNSAAIGMGLNIAKKEALSTLIRKLLENETKLVLDASTLIPEILPIITNTQSIITPHGGEYMRIFSTELKEKLEDQIEEVVKKSKEHGVTIILKGWNNIISDGKQVAVIERSTPAMTVGGTGDVLAGLVGGLFCKMDSFNASCSGVYFNGKAAELAYNKVGLHMMATDLLENLPEIMKKFDLES
ncbi:MAG: NAD(P)H-hydrate dehydratase [Nitrososphaeraceae archaeon]